MGRYVTWVEAEWAGELDSREEALKEAAILADARGAEVTVADEITGAEWVVEVHADPREPAAEARRRE